MNRILTMAALVALAVPASAAPPLTTIQDVIYRADGGLFDGTAEVSWRTFIASDSSFIGENRIPLKIVNGVLRVKLVPTTTASAGARYIVRYNTNGQTMFAETWSVPVSGVSLKVKDVRVVTAPSSGGGSPPAQPITIGDVTGLNDALDARPVKAAGYLPSRVPWIDDTGALGVVLGEPDDCIRVDGTAGPCGAGGTLNFRFVDQETPVGAVNGTNAAFALTAAPVPALSLHLYRNGLLQKQGLDYSLSGANVTFTSGSIPQSGDLLVATFRANP